MDRLSIVKYLIAAAMMGACVGCGKESPDTGAGKPPGRVVAVAAKGNGEVPLAEFCDVTAAAPPKKLTIPQTHKPVPSATSARWVNIWATWCKPCIKEMPMLVKWRDRFGGDGVSMRLDFLSVDEEAETLASFLKKHPEIPSSFHLKDPEALPAWLTELGLDPGAGLPIHIFTDKEDTVRCVRAGAIADDHYPTIRGLLK